MQGEHSIYQDYFHVLEEKISKVAYEDLMYENAVRFFKYHTYRTKSKGIVLTEENLNEKNIDNK